MSRRNVPAYSLHRGSGQACVKLDGKRVYLGVYGSESSHQKYASVISEWQSRQREAPAALTVGQLTVLYLQHCEQHYRKDGELTSEVHVVRGALRRLNALHRRTLANGFTPKLLKEVRELMIRDGLARTTINGAVSRIRSMFRWGVAEELVPVAVLSALKALRDLSPGRSAAREPRPVTTVPAARIDAIREQVPAVVWAMVQLQRLTGMRPGEVLIIRGCDLNTSGDVWEYTPERHKLEHKGISRVVMIGPAAQAVLRPLLRADTRAYLFSAEPDGSRPYRRDSYTTAIRRGCELAFEMPSPLRDIGRYVSRQKDLSDEERAELRQRLSAEAAAWRREHCWHPNQLRHSFATLARRAAGIEAARVTLGHSSAVTSEIYAERDLEAARAVVARIG
jgi:integrase